MPTTETTHLTRGIDRRDKDDRRAAVARAVDAEPLRVGLLLGGEKGERGLHVGDPAVGREPAGGPSLSPQPL